MGPKKGTQRKKEALPIWAQLRIAYDYATPEERNEFEKLSKSILKREKNNLKKMSACEPTDCRGPLQEQPCPIDCLGYNEKPPCNFQSPCPDFQPPPPPPPPPCSSCMFQDNMFPNPCKRAGGYIPPCYPQAHIPLPLGKNAKKKPKK